MKIVNAVFFRPLGSRNKLTVSIGPFKAIETLAMQPRRAAEVPNLIGVPRGATTPTQVYSVEPPLIIIRVTSQSLLWYYIM